MEPLLQCFNFDTVILTVHDGKGQKDRTVPIPESIVPELKRHLGSVIDTHQEDLKAGYARRLSPQFIGKEIQKCGQATGPAVVFSGQNINLCSGDKGMEAIPLP